MRHKRLSWLVPLLAVGLACEFSNISDAEDQLRRGPQREVEFNIPIVQDTFVIADVFDSLGVGLDTLPDGLLMVRADTVDLTITFPFGVPGLPIDTVVTLPPIWKSLDSADLNLGDFTDAVQDASLNTALAAYLVFNSADAPAQLINFRLGAVRVAGGSLDSVAGQPAFETDGGGAPILVNLVDPGDTTFAVARNEPGKIDTLTASALLNALVDRVLDGDTMALVGVGDLRIGDGTPITVNAGDSVGLLLEPQVGLDLTLGPGGAGIDLSNFVESGLDLDSSLTEDLTQDILDSIAIEVSVDNGVPFGLQVETAFVGDSTTGDIFTMPGAVLDTLQVAPSAVDANGRATTPAADTTGIVLTPGEAGETFNPFITIGVRVRLTAPPTGRGALQASDQIGVGVRARVWLTISRDTP